MWISFLLSIGILTIPGHLTWPTDLGCYRESIPWVLPHGYAWNSWRTIENCIARCRGYYYRFAGVRNGAVCSCGNDFPNQGPADNCNVPCKGDRTQICGGVLALNVYTVCENGTFRKWNGWQQVYTCENKCSYCKNGQPCHQIDGTCPNGQCESGWSGYSCTAKVACEKGKYGTICDRDCGHCLDGYCYRDNGNCPRRRCQAGYKGSTCIEDCENGFYGNCSQRCGHCKNEICDKKTGICSTEGCLPGWKGQKCDQYCKDNSFGPNCVYLCGECKDSVQCDTKDGTCPDGCKNGWRGSLCNQTCEAGTYGSNCSSDCGHCLSTDVCDYRNGTCPKGCEPGWQGDECNKACDNGLYGNCSQLCGNCKYMACDKSSGLCSSGCLAGWKNEQCTEECKNNTFGPNCAYSCGNCNGNTQCDTQNGTCQDGCQDGWMDTTCKQICPFGYFGKYCNNKCECNNKTCHHVNGTCLVATEPLSATPSNGSVIGGVMGALIMLIVVLVVIVLFVWLKRKRNNKGAQSRKMKHGKDNAVCEDVAMTTESPYSEVNEQHQVQITTLVDKTEPITQSKNSTKRAVSTKPVVVVKPLQVRTNKQTNEQTNSKKENPAKAMTQTDTEEPSVDVDADLYMNKELGIPLTFSQLREHIYTTKKEKDVFLNEFRTLPYDKMLTCHAATDPMNSKKKNRFKNVYAYDHSRVHLNNAPNGPHSDYINANYIHGYDKIRKFIATQGPKKGTIEDFWTMVWEQKVTRVVMVTNLVEGTADKCSQYWPFAGQTEKCGNFVVDNIKETEYPTFIMRTLKLDTAQNAAAIYDNTERTERTVLQYHYTDWPDKGVPKQGSDLLNYLRKIRSESEKVKSPIVVHCSAGIGRTGTYIALDILFDQAEAEGKIDVFTCVKTMRENRMTMVQTVDQYTFIYDTMLEAIMVGETHIPNSRFSEMYSKMRKIEKGQTMTGFEAQFKMLQDTTQEQLKERKSEAAKLPENENKNRSQAALPDDNERVLLMTQVHNRNSYINAVFSKSYKKSSDLILTQLPLEDTVVDFWRMVKDYDISTVVMLINYKGSEFKSCKYWPAEGTDKLETGPFTITKKDIKKENAVFYCHLVLEYKNESRPVCLVGVTDWQNDKWTPTDHTTLTCLYNKVKAWKHEHTGRMVLQCNDGGMKSGMYAVVSWMFDMINAEQAVDVFQITKQVLSSRPEFLLTLDQYMTIYRIAEEYMKNFQTYYNM